MKNNHFLAAIFLSVAFLVSACGGGSGGGGGGFGLNGGPVVGSVSNTTPAIYTFNVVADKAYTVSTVSTSGDIMLQVFTTGDPFTGSLIGYSWNSLSTTPYNAVSFIATFTGTVSVAVINSSYTTATASYTLQAFEGTLPIGGTRTDSTYNKSINYSFEAVGGTAYQVRLTPKTGNVNIGSVNAKLTASVGSSALTGTSMDTVTFLAPATQRYYVNVSSTSVDTTYDIQVAATTADPDLYVVVNSAVSDGANVTVNYTVYNQGIDAAGSFGVTGWSDAASAPTIGAAGLASATHASLAGGASVSGSFVMANAASSGTAYVIVDTVNAVFEASETNNVSSGKAWEKPLMAPQDFTFESGSIPAGLKMSGDASWAIDASTGSTSTRSLKAGTIGDSQSSCVAVSVANGASISFDYAVGSDYGDYLYFYIDGVDKGLWATGTVNWTHYTTTVTTAPHEYKWCYTKDSSWTSAPDSAWIDNIVVATASVDLQVAITSATSNGSNVTLNYTVTNAGNTASGAFNVDVWSDAVGVPTVGMTGNSTQAHTSLAAGASASRTVTIANANAGGTAYAIADTANSVVESIETNNVSLAQAWAVPVVLVSYNFEDGLFPTVMATSGDALWVNTAGGAGGSVFSLKAGTITHSQTSCVAVNASGSSSVSFDYSVSSESLYDYLRFYIDGVQMNAWSGTVAWTASGIISAGATGTHEYKWCYTKDNIVSSGSDTAWIDNIAIY